MSIPKALIQEKGSSTARLSALRILGSLLSVLIFCAPAVAAIYVYRTGAAESLFPVPILAPTFTYMISFAIMTLLMGRIPIFVSDSLHREMETNTRLGGWKNLASVLRVIHPRDSWLLSNLLDAINSETEPAQLSSFERLRLIEIVNAMAGAKKYSPLFMDSAYEALGRVERDSPPSSWVSLNLWIASRRNKRLRDLYEEKSVRY